MPMGVAAYVLVGGLREFELPFLLSLSPNLVFIVLACRFLATR